MSKKAPKQKEGQSRIKIKMNDTAADKENVTESMSSTITSYEEELSWCILMCQCYLKKADDSRGF